MENKDKKTATITIRISPTTKEKLEKKAQEKEWTLSQLCAKILTCYTE